MCLYWRRTSENTTQKRLLKKRDGKVGPLLKYCRKSRIITHFACKCTAFISGTFLMCLHFAFLISDPFLSTLTILKQLPVIQAQCHIYFRSWLAAREVSQRFRGIQLDFMSYYNNNFILTPSNPGRLSRSRVCTYMYSTHDGLCLVFVFSSKSQFSSVGVERDDAGLSTWVAFSVCFSAHFENRRRDHDGDSCGLWLLRGDAIPLR